MINLLRVELNRLRWRRACLVLLLASVAVPLIIATGTILGKDIPSEATDAAIQEEIDDQRRYNEREVERCVERPGRYGLGKEGDVRQACEDALIGSPEDQYYQYSWNVLDLDQERAEGSGVAVAAVLGVFMFLLGATFAGHDWATASMGNQLLFEPRRLRVWLLKALAVTGLALVVALASATLFWLVLDTAVSSGGVDPRSGALLDGLQHGWRAAGLAAAGALVGYAVTMLSRSTVFTLGALFAVAVAGGVLIGALGPDDPGPVDPTINAQAILHHGFDYYVEVPIECYEGGTPLSTGACDENRHRSLGEGVLYLGVVSLGAGAASAYSFRRRDVP